MSILLTHAYYLFEDKKEEKIMRPYPPLGLLYISSFLNENNVQNHVYDSTFYSFEDQLNFIEEKQPKIIAIYTNLMTKINVIKLIQTLKTNEKYGSPKIVLGGPDITFNKENYLNLNIDFLIIGEGEETMLELYDAITNNKLTNSIPGIAYLEDNEIRTNAPRIKIKDLSKLPLPNRAAIPVEKYLDIWKRNHGSSSMTVSTQRGCPYTCKWCSTAVYGQSYRRRPAKLVAEELKLLKTEYNPDTIWFVDDVFTVSHKWLRSFHEEVIKQDAIIPFECITRAERLNDEILQLLKEAGCYRIWIGAESGSQKIIDAMDRRVEVSVVKEAIQKTNQLDIETGTFIMLGYPEEEEKDIRETVQYLKEANPTHFTITVAYPIKGTSLYNEIEDQITVQPDWNTSTDRDIDFSRTYQRKYYDYAVQYVINEVNQYREKQKGNYFGAFKMKIKSTAARLLMIFSRTDNPYTYIKKKVAFLKKKYQHIKHKRYTQKKLHFYKKLINKGDLCFDVGANNGHVSNFFLQCGAKVVAFEPQESCNKELQKIKNRNLIIEKCGITGNHETRDFFISDISDISTFSNKFIETYKSDICQWNKTESIECYPLDHFINKYGVPDYCKVDVEGLELEIINSLEHQIPMIEFESTSDFFHESVKCIDHLSEMNYRFKVLRDSYHEFDAKDWLTKEHAIDKLKTYAANEIHTNIYCTQVEK